MLKASIALVGVAFAALAIGWVTGQDLLLYASIVCSALGGIALLKSTLADRKSRVTPAQDPGATKTQSGKKLSRREAKKQRKAERPVEEEGLLEEASSVRAVEGAPSQVGGPTLGEDQELTHHLGEPVGADSPNSSEVSVVDFRSRLAAALDTSSLEDQLGLEGEEEDDGLLGSRLKGKDAVGPSPSGEELGEESIEAERREEEEELAFVRAPGEVEGSREAGEEDDSLDWIRIDDLPQIAESFKLSRGSREPAARSSSASASRRGPARSTARTVTSSRATSSRATSSRATSRATSSRAKVGSVTAGSTKDKPKPSTARKTSPRKEATGARQSGGGQARASSKPKQPGGSTARGGAAAAKRAASAGGSKAVPKSPQPRVTGEKPGPGRPPKTKP